MKNSFYFFIAQISFHFYGMANSIVLGYFTNNTLVGYYSAAEKIIKAVRCLVNPIVNSVYPCMSRNKNTAFFKKIFYTSSIAGILLFLFFFLGNNFITNVLYGNGQTMTATLLKLFSFQFLILFPSMMIGISFLIPMGYAKYQNMSVIVGTIIHIIGLAIIIPFINPYLLVGMILFTETIIFLIKIYGVHKHKLWKT